jgi:site-specific DNA-adenine methylase
MRSPIYYFGGKGKMVKNLLPLIPPHKIYVEVFGGGASLLFAKKPSPVEVYNDIDSDLVNFFRVLRDPEKFEQFYRKAVLTPYSREEYCFCRETFRECQDDIERAYRFFVTARMSFSGRILHGWSFTVTDSSRGMAGAVSKWLSCLDGLPDIHERLMRVQIEHDDFRKIIPRYDTLETFFYCLPESERVLDASWAFPHIGDVVPNMQLANANLVNVVFKRPAKEEIVEFTVMGLGRSFHIRCSLDHKILVYDGKMAFYKEARELRARDMVVLSTDFQVEADIPPYQNKKVKHGVRKPSNLQPDLKDLCRFIGFYLAEGHKQSGLVFSFGIDEYAYCEEVKNLAKRIFGIDAKIYKQCPHPTTCQVFVLGRDLKDWFDSVVLHNNAKEKMLADWVMKLDPQFQIEIIKYWLKGDGTLWKDMRVKEQAAFRRTGCRNKYKLVGTTASEKLAWQIYHMALRCKLHPCIKKRQRSFDVYFPAKEDVERLCGITIEGRACKRRHWTEYGLVTPVTSVQIVPFEGTMVDISTKHGHFLHLCGCVMHNCDPPYVPDTRRSGEYAHEMTLDDHRELVEMLLAIKGKAMLSGYRHEVYEPLERAGWQRIDYETACHAVGRTRGTGILGEGAARAKQPRVESVWLSPNAQAQRASHDKTQTLFELDKASCDDI